MDLLILRKDTTWTIKARQPLLEQSPSMPLRQLQRLRQRFHEIARHHGSHATWLPETGFLVTNDIFEPEREFPYEIWMMQAWRETGNNIRPHPPAA